MPVFLSKLLGLPVIVAGAARQAGILGGLRIHLAERRVTAVELNHLDGYFSEIIPLERLQRLGPHVALIEHDPDALPELPLPPPEGVLSTSTLVGLTVITTGGDRVGKIVDILLDDRTFAALSFHLRAPVWDRLLQRDRINPEEIVACSADAMIVRGAAATARTEAGRRTRRNAVTATPQDLAP